MYSALDIKRFINFPVSSNCFIVSAGGNECIVVDPACGDGKSLLDHFSSQDLKPTYIVLTHEHFDHISSVECIRNSYPCKVVASAECSERICNSKKNLSLFYDQQGFTCKPADILIDENNFVLNWNDMAVRFQITPGHTEGSICFSIGNNLFTGDTLMNGYKPVVKLPGGNRKKLEESINGLLREYGGDTIVFPGHGETFILKDINKVVK